MIVAHRVWITADTHFGHKFVVALRGFDDVAEHDRMLIENWNSVVAPNDAVYHLGDVSMSLHGLESVAKLNGRKILVAGNHDQCWHRRSNRSDIRRALRKIDTYYQAGFCEVITSGSMIYTPAKSGPVLLSHLPMRGDHMGEERYGKRRPPPGELPILCGHVHGAWRIDGGKQLNVGVDVNGFRPILINDAIAEVRALEGTGAAGASIEGPWNEFGLA